MLRATGAGGQLGVARPHLPSKVDMQFDASLLDFETPSNEGVFMPFLDGRQRPITRVVDGKTEKLGVWLRGQYSDAANRAIDEQNRQAVDLARRNETPPHDQGEQNRTGILVACTVNWNLDSLDGHPFPCTPQNAQRFWSDSRFRRYRHQAWAFINNDANFSPPSADDSANTSSMSSS